MKNLETISWDNSEIYSGLKDPKISGDFLKIEEGIKIITVKISPLRNLISPDGEIQSSMTLNETIPLARELYRLGLDLRILLKEINTYSSCAVSVDSLNYEAKDMKAKTDQISSNLSKALKPLELFILRSPENYFQLFLEDPQTSELRFILTEARKQNDFLLSIPEEVVIEGHSLEGLKSWGKLYNDIAGSMKVSVGNELLGLATASNMLTSNDRVIRKNAYHAINEAWEKHEIAACAALNSINGWRLENNRARSKKRELHYLDKSCQQSRISRETLTALMDTAYEERQIGQEALRLMAREIGVSQLAPWDLLAPNPIKNSEESVSFPKAMEIICEAFNTQDPEMGAFAKMMMDKKWIDCSPSANRAQGAYCTEFSKAREPRVFMTYEGSMKNVVTLAHELGHAYHDWVMRDLKLSETYTTMTLAETASIFAETLVRDALLQNARTPEEKKKILWQEIESASSMLINIPSRFEFERRFVELKKTKTVTVPETKELMRSSWEYWYGDTLSEYNEMFWASKLHFSIPSIGFYNYPYLFGYLFSLGIYAQKNQLGAHFSHQYKSILLDTGTMMVEDLVTKHLQQDITKNDFWKHSMGIIHMKVKQFSEL